MIIAEFIRWYYYEAPLNIVAIWRNFLPFPFQFFGVRYHAATFFRPWRLKVVQFDEPNAITRFFKNLAARLIGSVIGLIMRTVVIIMGILGFIIVCIGGVVAEVLWLLLPLGLAFTIIQGFFLL